MNHYFAVFVNKLLGDMIINKVPTSATSATPTPA